jgi:beta-xylosidase
MFLRRSLVSAVLLWTAATGAAERRDGSCTLPEIKRDLPDPDVLATREGYLVFASNSPAANVQVIRSADLANWEFLPDALPQLPSWASPGFTWAPDVIERPDGSHAMYFSARHRDSDAQCIGVATSSSPEGPFSPVHTEPLVCPVNEGGAIDPATFNEGGRRYLLWKTDGNCCGLDTWITIQPLSPDGLKLEGTATRLIRQDQSWEGDVIEAPTLWHREGRYHLFYSANWYDEHYAIGYATAATLLGPYEKWPEPLVRTSEEPRVVGPGGQDILDVGGETLLIYHSWSEQNDYRGLNLDRLDWEKGHPRVEIGCQPARGPQ